MRQVRCRIADYVAVGDSYLVAGMRAYVRYAENRKKT